MALTRPLPASMRAVYLEGHGDLDRLAYRTDAPLPSPAAGEVLVRLRAAAVNNTDINLRSGWYSKAATGDGDAGRAAQPDDAGWDGSAVRFPRIQGADGCGIVVAAGTETDGVLLGQRVLIDPIVRPAAQGASQRVEYIGTDRDGCFAEYVAVPVANAVPLESPLDDAELASFPCSYLAAENMLARARIARGDEVLVTGASGGVGSAAVQLLQRRGARVTAVAAPDKSAAITALGARRVLPRDADLVRALGAESMDAVIDCVGGAQFASLLSLLRPRGRYAVAGAIAGPIVELDLRTLYLKDLQLLGCTISDPPVFRDLVGYIERGEIRPLVARRFPLHALREAQQEFLTRRHVGKIVVEI